ncbi:type II secretion system protein [Vibrio atlanticus]|uniref:type II secretion system protein n=1 Tax=Vibrio atlanticus TaxID=693153 RepID=UPI00354DB430
MNKFNRTYRNRGFQQLGFTLVELIIVILLIATVSAYAASRLSGRDSFSAFAAQEQVVSVIRQVQINRMQSNVDLGAVVGESNFILAIVGNCVGSEVSCTAQNQARSDWVMLNGVILTAASNTTPAIPLSLVNFDLLGNPTTGETPAGVVVNVAAGVVITITSNVNTCRVEINAQGYVENGGCS